MWPDMWLLVSHVNSSQQFNDGRPRWNWQYYWSQWTWLCREKKSIRLDRSVEIFTKRRAVESKLCHSSVAYYGGTSSIKEHLKLKHPADSPFSAEDGYKQRKLDLLATKWPCSSERAGAISEQICSDDSERLAPHQHYESQKFSTACWIPGARVSASFSHPHNSLNWKQVQSSKA